MRHGISGAPLPQGVRFETEITRACAEAAWYPCVVAAIQYNETDGLANAATVISADGGHGVMQLTAEYPSDWDDPFVNILYAIDNYLEPAEAYWAQHLQGDDLVRAIAAEYNAGRGNALRGHAEGDVDKYTTDHYAARALATYTKLVAGLAP